MAKPKDLEPVVTKIVDTLKQQQEKINKLNEQIGTYTEAYMDGVKDGIAFMLKKQQ